MVRWDLSLILDKFIYSPDSKGHGIVILLLCTWEITCHVPEIQDMLLYQLRDLLPTPNPAYILVVLFWAEGQIPAYIYIYILFWAYAHVGDWINLIKTNSVLLFLSRFTPEISLFNSPATSILHFFPALLLPFTCSNIPVSLIFRVSKNFVYWDLCCWIIFLLVQRLAKHVINW